MSVRSTSDVPVGQPTTRRSRLQEVLAAGLATEVRPGKAPMYPRQRPNEAPDLFDRLPNDLQDKIFYALMQGSPLDKLCADMARWCATAKGTCPEKRWEEACRTLQVHVKKMATDWTKELEDSIAKMEALRAQVIEWDNHPEQPRTVTPEDVRSGRWPFMVQTQSDLDVANLFFLFSIGRAKARLFAPKAINRLTSSADKLVLGENVMWETRYRWQVQPMIDPSWKEQFMRMCGAHSVNLRWARTWRESVEKVERRALVQAVRELKYRNENSHDATLVNFWDEDDGRQAEQEVEDQQGYRGVFWEKVYNPTIRSNSDAVRMPRWYRPGILMQE